MHIAVISDVHGNLPAFRAVLDEVDRRGPFDALVGGGDVAFGGAFPSQCLSLARERKLSCVRGNTDEWIVALSEGRDPDGTQLDTMRREAGAWAVGQLGDDGVGFLRNLPFDWRVTGPSGQQLHFVHATPWSVHDLVQPDANGATAERMLDQSGADVLLYGHIHTAYIREVGDRMLACVGSVGMPFDGDERPCFLVAEDTGHGWQLEHVRVPYDRESYVTAIHDSGIPHPEGFVAMIRR